MEKDSAIPSQPAAPERLSLAEEQRRAFDAERIRERKPILSLRWSGLLYRN